MSERDKKRYGILKSDPVKYEVYLEQKRQQRAARQSVRSYETERKRKWRAANRMRMLRSRQAGHSVENAVKRGRLERPTACSECGRGGKIEAHHHKGYARQFWLDVIWLCIPCHRKADKETSSNGL